MLWIYTLDIFSFSIFWSTIDAYVFWFTSIGLTATRKWAAPINTWALLFLDIKVSLNRPRHCGLKRNCHLFIQIKRNNAKNRNIFCKCESENHFWLTKTSSTIINDGEITDLTTQLYSLGNGLRIKDVEI